MRHQFHKLLCFGCGLRGRGPPWSSTKNNNNIDLDVDKAINILLKQNVPKRELAKALSVVTNMSVNDLYERVKDL